MIKKFFLYIIELLKEEYKFLIFLILLYIILQFPLNYYITTGGGISDVSSRIEVKDNNKSKGSFNISYVTQLDGTIMTVGLSYIIPTWEREKVEDYKYSKDESIDDIEFRSDLDLKSASSTATYWAYTLSSNKVKETSKHLYVIATFDKYKSNLKIQDEILSMDNLEFNTLNEYREYLQTKEKGDIVNIKVLRNNKEKIIKSKLYEEKNRRLLGVGLQFYKGYKTTPKVKIKFKRSESGPSGGLITTLEIYNQLTKKDLTKGLKIAGTGTIEEDGTIGEIGGVEHKLLGAEKHHADIFLVPSGNNYKDALKYKEDNNLKIRIIKVKTIEDAINKLEEIN